jgi:hypothetical protein
MSYDEVNDDLATANPPFNVIAVVPVHGRVPLLKHTIERLLNKNGCYKVICIGDGLEEKQLCESLGAVWVPHQNKPLGAKWNAGFKRAKDFNPDACLYVGSSDWLCNYWITLMKPHLDSYEMVGTPGCYFLDIGNELRLVKWDGYTGARADETIGIGRLLSKKLLDKLGWEPFDGTKDNSLDRNMKDRARALGFEDHMVKDDRLKACSISTNKWKNKHVFEMHWGNILPSTKIEGVTDFTSHYFPEANILCESLKGTLVSR